jgi:hypothetical protein
VANTGPRSRNGAGLKFFGAVEGASLSKIDAAHDLGRALHPSQAKTVPAWSMFQAHPQSSQSFGMRWLWCQAIPLTEDSRPENDLSFTANFLHPPDRRLTIFSCKFKGVPIPARDEHRLHRVSGCRNSWSGREVRSLSRNRWPMIGRSGHAPSHGRKLARRGRCFGRIPRNSETALGAPRLRQLVKARSATVTTKFCTLIARWLQFGPQNGRNVDRPDVRPATDRRDRRYRRLRKTQRDRGHVCSPSVLP